MWAFVWTYRKEMMFFAAVFLSGLALSCAVYLLVQGNPEAREKLLLNLASVGLTLAFVAVAGTLVGAVVKKVFEDHQIARKKEEARADFHRALLADLKSVYDRVENARLLIAAHKSAKTYGEQMRELPRAIVTLHNIKRALRPGYGDLEKRIKPQIDAAIWFLKELLAEFRDMYLEASMRQTEYEAKKKRHTNAIEAGGKSPGRPNHGLVWSYLTSLPHLVVLRAEDIAAFQEFETRFLNHIDAISYEIRRFLPGHDDTETPDEGFMKRVEESKRFAEMLREQKPRDGAATARMLRGPPDAAH